MGKLQIKDMVFFSHHGCFEEERKIGNKFVVNFTCEYDMSIPCKSDNIEDAVDYPKIYNVIASEMAINSNLLEHLANRILEAIKIEFPEIEKAEITIDKLFPPIGGVIGASSVTLSY